VSCTHNDDVVDGSHEAASGHTCNNNKQKQKQKHHQRRRQFAAWQHQHATVHNGQTKQKNYDDKRLPRHGKNNLMTTANDTANANTW